MKKKLTALLLGLTLLVPLAGCFRQQAAQEPEREPDTTTRTLTRAIGSNQTVVYRFHTEVLASWDYAEIDLVLFDQDVESYDQADNWCIAWVGDVKGDHAFSAGHPKGASEEGAWSDPFFDSEGRWSLLAPYDSIRDVKGADMVLTFTRSGQRVRAVLEIDGTRIWTGQQTVGNLTQETVYLYLFTKNRSLTNIEYQDMGYTWLMPGWLGLLVTAAVLVVACWLHNLAKRGEDALYLTDGGCVLHTTGLFVCGLVFILLLCGRGHPELLSTLSLGTISLRMPAEGLGFWLPTILAGVGAVGLTVFLLCMAFEELGNPAAYLLGGLLFGLCHTLWYGCIAYMILLFLDDIFALLVGIAFVVFLVVFAVGAANTEKKYKQVTRTTRIYNSIGNLVDAKYEIDYVEVPEEGSKKK